MDFSRSSTQELLSSSNTDDKMTDNYEVLFANQREFFQTGRTTRLSYRVEQLRKLRDLIIKETPALCDAVYKDLRRKGEITQVLEIGSIVSEIDSMIRNIEEWSAPISVPRTLTTMLDTPQIYKEPKGVVLIIGPWNYPIWCVLGPLVNVIAAGNTVMIKPSEVAPHVADVYKQIFANFPENYIAVVQGGVPETTELLKQPFNHVIYTGNTTVGHIVMEAAAKHLSTVTLELGGKSPVVVLADADVEVTARRIIWGKMTNCGQTCVAPDYVLVVPAIKSRLITALSDAIRQFYGDDVQYSDDYSRIINGRHFQRLATLLEQSAGTIVHKGGSPNADDLYIPPTILDVKLDDVTMKEEIFGPILPIATVQNLDEAIEVVSQGQGYPLSAYIFTRDEASVEKFIARVRSGGICVNDVILHAATEGFHFGGFGKSGMGRYRGKAGFDEFTHEKPVLKRGFFGDGLAAGRYPPITKKKVEQLKRVTSTRLLIPPYVWRFISALPYLLSGIALGYFSSRYFPGSTKSGFYYRY